MKKKVLATLLATTMVFGLAACGNSSDSASTDTANNAATTDDAATADTTATDDAAAADDSASSGDLIKVGIINNDPNESGYRTANDKSMRTDMKLLSHTALRTTSRSQQLRSSSRMVLITYFFPQQTYLVGILYYRMQQMQA